MSAAPTDPINVVDLFAGCGGFTQGFHEFVPDGFSESPFRTVGAVEWDKAAAATYAKNFAKEAGGIEKIFAGDIKDWNPGDVNADVHVILGGPPCQGFSGLGKGDPNDPRNKLWQEYVRVVEKLNPAIFIIENVDRFFKSAEYISLRKALDGGPLKNYRISGGHLIAADYGSPQLRKRTIVVATHKDVVAEHPTKRPMGYPEPTHGNPDSSSHLLEGRELKPWVPIERIFGDPDDPKRFSGTPVETSSTELPSRRTEVFDMEFHGPFRTGELHIGRNPTELSLARYRSIPRGGNRRHLPPELSTESWMNHRNGSGDVMGRLHLGRPSVTIRTEFYKPEKGRYLHPWADRAITHLEAALIQGFPRDFLWCGSKSQIARQIGNAVPVDLSRAIAKQVYEYLSEIPAR